MKGLGRSAMFLVLLSVLALLLVSVPALAGPAAPPESAFPEEINSAPTAPAGGLADTVAMVLDILHQVMKFVVDNQSLMVAFGIALAGIIGAVRERRQKQAHAAALEGVVSGVEALRSEVDDRPSVVSDKPAERIAELTRSWKQGAPRPARAALEAAVARVKGR